MARSRSASATSPRVSSSSARGGDGRGVARLGGQRAAQPLRQQAHLAPERRAPVRLGPEAARLAQQAAQLADPLRYLPRLRFPPVRILAHRDDGGHGAERDRGGDDGHRRQRDPPALARLGGAHLGRGPIHLRPPGPRLRVRPERRDRRRHLRPVRRTVFAFHRQAPLRQRHQFRFGPARVQPRERVVQLAPRRQLPRALRVRADERRLTREHHGQNRPQTEHVRPLVDQVDRPDRLFGRHERRSAHEAAVLRFPAGMGIAVGVHVRAIVRRCRRSGGGRHRRTQHLRQAPVHHLHFAERPHHHVRRLQVPVDDAPAVRVADRLADRFENPEQPAAIRLRELLRQRPPLDELHRQPRPAVRQQARGVDRRDARMLQLRRDARLFQELRRRPRARRVLVLQHLDRHVPIQAEVAGPVDHAHPAAPDLRQQLEPRRRRGARSGPFGRGVEIVRRGIVG
jgi:hypothetical protein